MKSNNETVKRYEISLFLCPLSGDETSSDQISPKRIFFFSKLLSYYTYKEGQLVGKQIICLGVSPQK